MANFESFAVGKGGAGGLRFKSRAGQIGHSVAKWLATVATFLRKELCCPGAMTRRWAPPTCYTLRRITASIMKDLIDLNIEKVLKKSADSLQTRCSLLACVL